MDDIDKAIEVFVEFLKAIRVEHYTKTSNANPDVVMERGKRYIRLVAVSWGSRSACGFIDTTNGDLLKSAGWKGPERNYPRGNVFKPEGWSKGWYYGIS